MLFRSVAACAAMSLSVWPLFAYAEPAQSDDSAALQVSMLDPVVVTPTLTSRTTEASLSSVTVIDEKQLRERQPQDMTEMLRGQPGVDITGNGAFGKATSVYLRGTGSSSTLLMVDGVRLRSATAGSPSWQFLPTTLIDRIEIVRGPRGSLYGADAVGGVVQVFTPGARHLNNEQSGWMELGGGSFNSRRVAAGAQGEQDGTRYNVAVDRFDTDGTEIREGSEDRGYDNTSAVARLTHRFDNDAEIGVFGFRAAGSTEFEGSTPEQEKVTDYAMQIAGVKGQLWVTENWLSKLILSDARDDNENFTDGDRDSIFNTRSRAANWQNVFALGDHQLVVGADYLQDLVDSTTLYSEEERENTAGFAQLLLNFGAFDVQASGRYDDNEAYGSETTGGLALGYKLDAHHRIRASYGTAFRAPTFNDLYFPGFGNDQLDPESSKSTEVGARGQYQYWYWDIAAYQTDVDDLIAYALQGGRYAPFNVNRARIRGAEVAVGVDINQWRAGAAFTAQDPEDRDTGLVLQRQSQRSFRFDLDRALGEFSLGGSVVLQGHRYNDADNDVRLSGFGLLDLRAGWNFAPNWSTRLAVKNVLDKEYTTAQNFAGWNYMNAGRSVMLSLRYDR